MDVLTEHGTGHVRILNLGDRVVLEADSTDLSEEAPENNDHPQTRLAEQGEQDAVRLVPGDYRVECSMDNCVTTDTLHVIPASSGSTEE